MISIDNVSNERKTFRLGRLYLIVLLPLIGACWQSDRGELQGDEADSAGDFEFLGATVPCFLEVQPDDPRSIRVNCFHIDGVLHIHSNRFAKLPRWSGESWVDTVQREPRVRVAIAGKIYLMRATPIDSPDLKAAILADRGYWYVWDGITIFRFSNSGD